MGGPSMMGGLLNESRMSHTSSQENAAAINQNVVNTAIGGTGGATSTSGGTASRRAKRSNYVPIEEKLRQSFNQKVQLSLLGTAVNQA